MEPISAQTPSVSGYWPNIEIRKKLNYFLETTKIESIGVVFAQAVIGWVASKFIVGKPLVGLSSMAMGAIVQLGSAKAFHVLKYFPDAAVRLATCCPRRFGLALKMVMILAIFRFPHIGFPFYFGAMTAHNIAIFGMVQNHDLT